VSRAKQNSVDRLAIGARGTAWIVLSLLLIAAPVQANQIVQVRVGNHPSFTRLVFEMDAFTGYQVQREMGPDGAEQLTVTLDASTASREISSKSVGIESVSIPASADHAIAQIRLRKPGLQMKEMILSNPPRIVLDFVHSAAAVAELTGDPYAKPAPAEPKTEPKPAPKPVVAKTEPKPAPKSVIAVPEPKPAPEPVIAVPEPKPAPEPVIAKPEPKPEPEPVIARVIEPKPAPKIDPVEAPVEPTPEPVSVPVEPESLSEAVAATDSAQDSAAESILDSHEPDDSGLPTETAEIDTAEEATPEQIADASEAIAEALPDAAPQAAKPAADAEQRRAPSPSDINRRGDKPKPAGSGLPFDMLTLAGIAAAVLIVVVFVAVRIFRRRSLPQDLDVTTLADAFDDDAAASDDETSESEASERIPSRRFGLDDSTSDGGPEPLVEEQNTAAYSLSEVAANVDVPETGLYDEDSEGEKPMDMETTDLPTDRDKFSVPPAAMMGGDSDLSQLVHELASRIANLEARLDEANDSRERLERQVAAQSEELRVQRAAIARTQRAIRSLSRSEEDQATEPALREPSQPAK